MKLLIKGGGIVLLLFILMSSCVLTACNIPGIAILQLPSVDVFEVEQYRQQAVDSSQISRVTGRSTTDELYAAGPQPDLIVESITGLPQNPSKGDTITISATVKNQGNAQSKTTAVGLYVDGNYKAEQVLAVMEAGSTVKKDFTWIAQQGSTVFNIVVDANNIVLESNETNNEKSITISSLSPDLIVQSINWLPVGPLFGDNATFYFAVKNQGEGTAVSSFGYFYMDNELQCTVSFDSIKAGQICTKTLSWPVKAGIYTVKLEIDPNDNILESIENNNEKTVDFTPILPDLFVSQITWLPTTPSVGDLVNFSIIIGNKGRAVSGNCVFHLYVGDVLSIPGVVGNIAVGGTDTILLDWIAQPGQHKVKIILDPYNVIAETAENNNEVTMSNLLSVRAPDIAVDSITWSPEEASPGDTLTFSVTIRNRGYGEAISTQMNYYIDGVQEGTRGVSPLSYGGIQKITFNWIVKEGSHTFKVIADSKNDVFESNEGNNESIAAYPVPPDLVIKNITLSPSEPVEGDNVTFIIITENEGGVIAEYHNVACYIDDVYVSYISGGPIDSWISDNLTFTWTAELGGHNCKAIIDPFNNLFEESEENNEKTVAFLVLKAASEPVTQESTTPDTGDEQSIPALPGDSNKDSENDQTNLWFFSLLGGGVLILLSYLFYEYKRRHG